MLNERFSDLMISIILKESLHKQVLRLTVIWLSNTLIDFIFRL